MSKIEKITPLCENRFLNMYDLEHDGGRHYFVATRHKAGEIVGEQSEEEFNRLEPDAVSCVVILKTPICEPKLLIFYEYRYPISQYLLSIPAGLIDDCDKGREDSIIITAKREIEEETGVCVKESDKIYEINHCLFSSPGLTDESNALVCAVVSLEDFSCLNQQGAVGGECFDGFSLVNKEEAKKMLKEGRDAHGHFYSMFTWAALSYFVSDEWREEND